MSNRLTEQERKAIEQLFAASCELDNALQALGELFPDGRENSQSWDNVVNSIIYHLLYIRRDWKPAMRHIDNLHTCPILYDAKENYPDEFKSFSYWIGDLEKVGKRLDKISRQAMGIGKDDSDG
jgi:hypothetical protein